MSIIYELNPIDTLFFRGSQPMEAGQLFGGSLFPPPLSVIEGAFRSAVLRQRGIAFSAFNAGKAPDDVTRLIGASGGDAPFAVTSFLMRKNGALYAPAPYSWYVDTDRELKSGKDYAGLVPIKARNGNAEKMQRLGAVSSAGSVPLVHHMCEARTLGGCWIRLTVLEAGGSKAFLEGDILLPGELYASEMRTGISLLDKDSGASTRRVQDGALFSSSHIRLVEGVSIVIGIDRECGLAIEGTLQLGGEKRLCGYRKIDTIDAGVKEGSGELFLSLVPVVLTLATASAVFCTGKISLSAGWDMAKGFHKSSKQWLPAGSVYHQNVTNQCIRIS